MELREGWFVPDSIDATLSNVMETFDREYLRSVSTSKLAQDLTKEILFLSAYEREREPEIISYIREHIRELQARARKLANTNTNLERHHRQRA